MPDLLSQMSHETLMDWLKTPKTWIAGGVLLFTLGGTVTLVKDTFHRNEILIIDTYKIIQDHQVQTTEILKTNKQNSEQVQNLLQEVVRVSKVNCLNTAKDDNLRRACVGLESR